MKDTITIPLETYLKVYPEEKQEELVKQYGGRIPEKATDVKMEFTHLNKKSNGKLVEKGEYGKLVKTQTYFVDENGVKILTVAEKNAQLVARRRSRGR